MRLKVAPAVAMEAHLLLKEVNRGRGASQAEIASYISQVQAAIKGHLYDWDTYKGKTCTLRVNLAQDGTLLSVKSEGRSCFLSANAGGNQPDEQVPETAFSGCV